MKYIKLFEYFKEDVERFCEEYLAYFLDDNPEFILDVIKNKAHTIRDKRNKKAFKPAYPGAYEPRRVIIARNKEMQEISVRDNKKHSVIILLKGRFETERSYLGGDIRRWKALSYKWDDVKDSLIPLIDLLDSTYGIKEISFIDSNDNVRGVVKDKIDNFDFDIKEIYITVRS